MKNVISFNQKPAQKAPKFQKSTVSFGVLLVFGVLLIMPSCKKDKESPSLSVDKPTVAAVAAAGTYPVEVKSNGEWSATVTPATATWCTLSPASGKGNGIVTVSVAANATTAVQTATVTLSMGELTKTVTVTQEAGAATLNTDKTAIPATAAAATYTIAVTSNGDWTAAITPAAAEWLTLSPASGTGDGSFNVTATANTAATARNATIIVTGGGLTRQIEVSQSAADVNLNISPATTGVVFNAKGAKIGNADFTVTSNTGGWNVVTSAPSWCFAEKTGNNLVISASANTSVRTRTANVTITANNAAPIVLNVTQESGLLMTRVTGGNFTMGNTGGWTVPTLPPIPAPTYPPTPTHKVSLNDFSIGTYEVTQAQWIEVMGSWPGTAPTAANGLGDNYPAYSVSWDDAQEFITRLNQMTGETYRLPTESEWEYAAREGNISRGYQYSGAIYANLDNVAWYTTNSDGKPHTAGSKSPNQLGIYDMSGNVWEWCSDWLDVYTSADQINPQGPAQQPTSARKVNRGGGYDGQYYSTTVYYRSGALQNYRGLTTGFRIARTAQ